MGEADKEMDVSEDWCDFSERALNPKLETQWERYQRLLKQVMMVVCVCQAFVSIGMIASWPNPALADLHTYNTTLYGTQIYLTPTQKDMLGSLLSLGSVPGTWIGGMVVAWQGRRRTLMLLLVPALLGWGLVAIAPSPSLILAGRFFNGISCGMTTVSGSIYIIELSDMSIRGGMAVLPTLFIILGFIFTVSLGFALRWFQIPLVSIGVSVSCTFSMFFLPESPSYLAVTSKESKARKLLIKLRGPDADIEEELKVLEEKNKSVRKQSIFRVIRQPAIAKSMGILVTLFFIHNFSGLTFFIVNTIRIFYTAGTSIDERLATLFVFVAQFIGACSSVYLIDVIGRRHCLIISLFIAAMCQAVFGAYLYCKKTMENSLYINPDAITQTIKNASLFEELVSTQDPFTNNATTNSTMLVTSGWTEEYNWVPLVCLLVFMLGASVGIMPVPFILVYEYFPTTVRSQMSSLCVLINSLFNVLALAIFTPMQAALTPAGLYWFCSGVCVLGIIVSYAFVRETKGTHVG